jgi:hypothetical protein
MMPIATTWIVTADQLFCWLAAADDHAWPEGASTAPNDHSFVHESQSITIIAAIIPPFGPPRHRARGPHRRPLHRSPQPNPHSAR